MKENLPMKNEDNIFSKIIVFFKKLFYKSDKNTNNEFNKVETENISAPKTEAPKKAEPKNATSKKTTKKA